MADQRGDEPGRRHEDKRWAHVQAQLATTKQAIEMLEATVVDLKDELRTFDASLYGGVRDKDSIHFRLKRVEQQTQELHLVVIGEANGAGGLQRMVQGISHSLDTLAVQINHITESKKDRIARLSAIAVAGITTLGLVFTNLDKIAQGVEQFKYLFRREPLTYESVMRDIEKMRKTRGPEVEKMLKEIERSRRRRR